MAQTSFTGPLASGTREAGTSLGPNIGLATLSQTGTITQNSTTTVDLTFYLPAGSQIVDVLFDVLTAYDSVTSATGTVGPVMAALLTRMSMRPKRLRQAATTSAMAPPVTTKDREMLASASTSPVAEITWLCPPITVFA